MNLEYAFIDYFCRLEILCFRKYKEESIESSFDKYLEYLNKTQRRKLLKLRKIKNSLFTCTYKGQLKPSNVDMLVEQIQNVQSVNIASP